jgi:hypothetical protein
MLSYIHGNELAIMKKAYDYASNVHFCKCRALGEP